MAKTIMLVDNDSDVCSTIETLLKKNGYRVISAVDAEECLKKLKSNKLNLLLISAMMPRKKILENAVKIKGLKIAYLIADESETENLELYENVVGFIDEPRNINDFLARIKEMTG